MPSKRTIPRICEECGSQFMAWNGESNKPNRGRFCSKKCSDTNHGKSLKGKPWPAGWKPRKNTIEDLVKKVVILPNGCWEWTGQLNNMNYGFASIGNGKKRGAHRIFHEHKHGKLPRNIILDHRCHDPKTCVGGLEGPHRRCVNPDHTERSTYKKNNHRTRSVGPWGTGKRRIN